MTGILGSGVARADSATGPPRRLRNLPPAKSEAVCAAAMVLRAVVTKRERDSHLCLGEIKSCFTAPEVPSVSLSDYLKRLCGVGRVSRECVVIALLYLDRIVRNPPFTGFAISIRTVHRLLLAGVVVASKAHEEKFGDNLWYAKAGGIPLAELNTLELTFLSYVKWNLRVTPDTYAAALHRLAQVYANPGAIARARNAASASASASASLGSVPEAAPVSHKRVVPPHGRDPTGLASLSAKITSSLQAAKLFIAPDESPDPIEEDPISPSPAPAEDPLLAQIQGRLAANREAAANATTLEVAPAASSMMDEDEDSKAEAVEAEAADAMAVEAVATPQVGAMQVEEDSKEQLKEQQAEEKHTEAEEESAMVVVEAEPLVVVASAPVAIPAAAEEAEEEEEAEETTEEESTSPELVASSMSGAASPVIAGSGDAWEGSWELAEVEGALNRKAAKRGAKAKKNAEKAKKKQAIRVAEGDMARREEELRAVKARHEAEVALQEAREKEATMAAVAREAAAELLREEEAALQAAREKGGWAAVAAYGAQKQEQARAAAEARRTHTSEGKAKKASATEAHSLESSISSSDGSLPVLEDMAPGGGCNAAEDVERSEWLVAAIRGAAAQEKARTAKEEARLAREAARAKEAEALRLEQEASVEVGKFKKLAELQGKLSMQLWWSSFNPNQLESDKADKAPVEPHRSPSGPKKPRLYMMVHARA